MIYGHERLSDVHRRRLVPVRPSRLHGFQLESNTIFEIVSDL